ncbi:D-xylulose reductase [Scheffersomyces amazonensis]|uniref:D-xylulose reductase n=1 Tax=Scheffersomyces amazonensis TaxID=1078765 RepID=UPI00315C623C
MNTNESLVLNKIDDISFQFLETPTITNPNDVIVQVKKTGICGSDIHFYAHGGFGYFRLNKPMVLGHESSGVVVEVGNEVKSLKVGDKVAIEPGVPSRFSDAYKSGHYNLCPHMVFAATPNLDINGPSAPGTLCKYFKSPEDFLVKLPDHLSLELGALVEPLSVGVHACKIGSVKFGDIVVVFGAGPVGLLAASTAKKFGATKVMVVDVVESKLEMALRLNMATHVFNSKNGTLDEMIKELGQRPNVVLECSGAEVCIQSGVHVLAPGGRFIQVGNTTGPASFPITEFATKELTLFGSFRYGFDDYKTGVALLDANYKDGEDKAGINYLGLITHRFKFKDAIEAYDLVRAGKSVKCIIDGPE